MKFKSILIASVLLTLWQFSTSSRRDPNNPPTGNTGGPGETTCAKSGCHTGGAFVGQVTLQGLPDTVVANQTYVVQVRNKSNASKAGFQLTCLDGNNTKCGTLTSATGVNVTTASGGRQYARQSSPKTLVDSVATFQFNWKAPATAVGDSIRFFFASLCANGNNGKTGDNVLLGNRKVYLAATSGTTNPNLVLDARLYPTLAHDQLNIEVPAEQWSANSGLIRVLNVAGESVLQTALNTRNTLDISSLPSGTYFAEIRTGQRLAVRKFVKF